MIFETLHESAKRDELLLVDGGFCHWHLRRDGQLTIREIIATPERQGVGTQMLETLKSVPGAVFVFARCPADLPANKWYAAMGFERVGRQVTKSGRALIQWRLPL